MDFLKDAAAKYGGQAEGQQNNQNNAQNTNTGNQQSTTQGQSSSGAGGFLGGLGDKFNSAAGGGRESEKNEDYLDK